MPVGFAVECVSGVHEFIGRNTEPAPDWHSPVDRNFVRGVVMLDDRRVVVLETDRLIDRPVLASWAAVRVPGDRRAH